MADPKSQGNDTSPKEDKIVADNTTTQQIKESAREDGVSLEEAYQTWLEFKQDSQED